MGQAPITTPHWWMALVGFTSKYFVLQWIKFPYTIKTMIGLCGTELETFVCHLTSSLNKWMTVDWQYVWKGEEILTVISWTSLAF